MGDGHAKPHPLARFCLARIRCVTKVPVFWVARNIIQKSGSKSDILARVGPIGIRP